MGVPGPHEEPRQTPHLLPLSWALRDPATPSPPAASQSWVLCDSHSRQTRAGTQSPGKSPDPGTSHPHSRLQDEAALRLEAENSLASYRQVRSGTGSRCSPRNAGRGVRLS